MLVRSWERQEPSLYGRMDLHWDGTGAPKLLEYNADTATSLFESSVVQWEWLTCAYPDADQFNSVHEALIAAWPAMRLPPRVHFTSMRDSTEDPGNVDYLRDTASQAGLDAPFLFVDEIGWDGRRFVDLDRQEMRAVFKLYPWEFLLRDNFGNHVAGAATRWIEPAWRLLLSGKGILALLWELFPGHPNLLPAFREPGRTGRSEIAKPLFGREGANISAPGIKTDGPYGAEGYVYQQWLPLPRVNGHYPVIGGWIIAGQPHGIGIREWELIRAGNAAVALSLGGAMIGFALPLAAAVIHSASLADMVVSAAVALVVQLLCFAAMRLLRRDATAALARGDMAEGVLLASVSLVLGILNAACLG